MNHKSSLQLAAILLALASLVVPARADWIRVIDIPQQEATALFVENENLYVASADEIYRRTSAGEEFIRLGSPTPGNYIQSLLAVDGRLLAGTYVDGIFESTNGGADWVARNTGLSGIGSQSIVCLARRGDSVYLGTPGSSIFVSSLTGTLSWQPFRDSLGWRVAWEAYSLYSWKGMLFTGSGQNAYIHRNLPNQSHWQGFPFNESVGTGLAMLGFGQLNDTLIGVASNGIYTSADSGVTWTHFPAPFSAASAGSVVTSGTRTFAMLSHLMQGTFLWEWAGDTWTLFHHQADLMAYDIVYFDHRLYAAAFDGLWQFPLDPTDVDPGDPGLPSAFTLSQNYPNPFNPTTTIAYRLNERSHVTLTVFNSIGQVVRTLVDTELPAGQHHATWTGTDTGGNPATSGVYFYRLETNRHAETRKMVLLK